MPVPVICGSQTSAGAFDTRIMKSPRFTSLVDRYSAAMACLRTPGELYTTGILLALAQARRRRLNHPAMRIR